jgi:outer membrane protein OmpA-like peptidoglycan-associated protein
MMSRALFKTALAPVLALALSVPGTASAQDLPPFVDAHRIQLAAFDGDLRDPLLLQRPGRFRQWDWFAGGVLEYTNAPLVRYEVNGQGDEFRTNVLDDLVGLNISGGVAFHERFRFDVAFPIFFANFSSDGFARGAGFGDIRFTGLAMIVMPNEDDEGFGLGVSLHLDAPSGAEQKFVGQRAVAGGGDVSASYAYRGLTVTANAGLQFQPRVDLDNYTGDDQLNFGVGVGYLVHETTSLNLETSILPAFRTNRESLTATPIELTGSLRHRRPNGGHLLVGAAGGLSRGVGAARFRLFVGGGFGKIAEPPPKDIDLDGILDDVDACPEDPETFNDWQDADGCPDALSNVDILVTYQGEPVAGAEMEVTYGESDELDRMQSRETARRKENLRPGTVVDAKATSGSCLAGDASLALDEGDNELNVILRPLRGGKVEYELTGPKGEPIPDAIATWRTDAEGCAEPDGYNLGQTGTFDHPLGAGTHTVFIDAPGYRIYRETITLAPGDVYVIRTEMKPTKVQVDKREIKILEKVFFETASDVIKPESFELLDEVADTIVANDVGRVRVEGHTDSRGGDDYNLDLSQRRADSVRNYLIQKGVPADQLIAVGYGETQPIATNNTSAGRAQNRRVVFTLVDQESQVIEVKDDE